jgi:hypothetical protein
VEREFGSTKASRVDFHRRLSAAAANHRRFNGMQVVGEGTTASFSTTLAFGVLEFLGPLLALS